MLLLPVLVGGSMLFWTLAFGLGGLSLMAVTGLATVDDEPAAAELAPTAVEPMPGQGEPISVQIEESAEPQDVDAVDVEAVNADTVNDAEAPREAQSLEAPPGPDAPGREARVSNPGKAQLSRKNEGPRRPAAGPFSGTFVNY